MAVFRDVTVAPWSGRGRVGGVPCGEGWGRPRRFSQRVDQTRSSVSRFSSDCFKRKTRQRHLFLCENMTLLELCCTKNGEGILVYGFFSSFSPLLFLVQQLVNFQWIWSQVEVCFFPFNVLKMGEMWHVNLWDMLKIELLVIWLIWQTQFLLFFFFFIDVQVSLHKPDSPVVGVCCAFCPLGVCWIHWEKKNPPWQQLSILDLLDSYICLFFVLPSEVDGRGLIIGGQIPVLMWTDTTLLFLSKHLMTI